MTYSEFKALLPFAKTAEADYPKYYALAMIVIEALVSMPVSELSEADLVFFNKAVAWQIELINDNGGQYQEDNITSQSINGVSTSFANSGKGKMLLSDMARNIILNAGLGVC